MNIASSAAPGAATAHFSTAYPIFRNQDLAASVNATAEKLRLAYPLTAVKLLMGIHLEAWLRVMLKTLPPQSAPASCQFASR